MMALHAQAHALDLHSNLPTLEEEDDYLARILGIRDAVVAGTHPNIKLPAAAIAALKATLVAPDSTDNASQRAAPNGTSSSLANGVSPTTNAASPVSIFPGLPGLSANVPSAGSSTAQHSHAKPTSSGLDPIFLEKSDSLVRAEGHLKRQRIERDLVDHWEKKKPSSGRDKEFSADAPSSMSIDAALADAMKRVKPVSGLKSRPRAASIATSFDENDYYSSQVQSEWSSEAGSDHAVGAFTAGNETLDRRASGAPALSSKSRGKQPVQANGASYRADIVPTSKNQPQLYANEHDGVHEADDEDEEYSPPEPTAFESYYDADTTMDPVADEDDDDSEYEPGEVTQGSVLVTPYPHHQSSAQPSPQVPIYRNHLSHIAAPQPNRVSPLAVQKGPSIELELVNGRPEMVSKPQKRNAPAQSRPSSASPSGPGASARKKKGANSNKKRKREQEATNRSKKRQDRQSLQSPPSPVYREPYIKPEPVSPPPFANVPEAPPYPPRFTNQTAPIQLDPESPRHPPQPQYVYASTPRQEYAPRMPPPAIVRVSSASGYRPPQRDTQDLRRVASLHYAQRPASPTQRVYSPAGHYPPNGRAYAAPRQGSVAPYSPYGEDASGLRYAPAEPHHEPVRLQEYRESSPALMAPPPVAPRRVVVDQYGNRYYAEQSISQPRASVAPVARHPEPELGYERAPSRMTGAYQPPPQPAHYEPAEPIMAPPPPPIRHHAHQEQDVEYIDARGYRVREYSSRPVEPVRYSHAPKSPLYPPSAQFDHMPPPSARPAPRELHYDMPPPPMPQQSREPTSPVYAPPPRAFSVRPDGEDTSQITYAPRQASVAPVQYVRHDAAPPARAISVMPGPEYGAPAYQPRAPSYAPPPAARYVDEYGREMVPREMTQVGHYRY
jgi:hypothetical protein